MRVIQSLGTDVFFFGTAPLMHVGDSREHPCTFLHHILCMRRGN